MKLPPAERTYWGICATFSHRSRVGIAANAGQRRKLHGTLQKNHRQPTETPNEPHLGKRADEVFFDMQVKAALNRREGYVRQLFGSG